MREHKIKRENKFGLYAYVIAVVLIWSSAYPLMYYAVFAGGFPSDWVPISRTLLPAIAITLYVYLRGHRLPPLKDMRWLWYGLMGVLGMTAPFLLQARGHAHGIESGLSSILINGGMPLMTIILAHIFINTERLTLRKSIGFIIGFIGVVFLFLPENLNLELVKNWQGQSYMLLCALSFAFAAIVAKRAPETQADIGAAIMLITAAVTALFLALLSDLPSGNFSNGVLLAVFVLSIFSTGLSDILYLRVIKLSGPSMIGKINYLVPIFASIWGMMFLGEAFSWRSVAAMMIIITGLLVARADEKLS